MGGEKAFQFANAGVFSEYTVVNETQAVVIDADVPLASASLIGCAVLTGTGAVLNRAKPRIGQSALVIGIGGIGLNVLQGLALSGCGPIIAVDANPAKEAASLQFGATHFIAAGPDVDTAEAVKAICPTGVDFAFECVGHPALIRQSIDLLDWGGSCVLLGVPKFGSEASFVVNTLYNDKSILGCRYGSARPHHDIPLFVKLYKEGKLKLDELVSARFAPEQVQDAMHGGGSTAVLDGAARAASPCLYPGAVASPPRRTRDGRLVHGGVRGRPQTRSRGHGRSSSARAGSSTASSEAQSARLGREPHRRPRAVVLGRDGAQSARAASARARRPRPPSPVWTRQRAA